MHYILIALCFISINALEFNCIDESSCSFNGFCFNETKCICLSQYGTKENGSNRECNYKRRSKRIAFFLSFYLGPIGFDQVYMGRALHGSLKIILGLLFIVLGMGLYYLGKAKEKPKLALSGKILEITGTVVIIIWWFVDWILILIGVIKDSNGQFLHNDLE